MIVSMVVAFSDNGVIGKDNGLPWSLPKDMEEFRRITSGHHVVMGRRTWESIPERFRPLRGRTNVVLSRDPNYRAEGAMVLTSLDEAIKKAKLDGESELFVIGGAQVYEEALESDVVDRAYVTRVHGDVEGDAYMTALDNRWTRSPLATWHEADANHSHAFTFERYERHRARKPTAHLDGWSLTHATSTCLRGVVSGHTGRPDLTDGTAVRTSSVLSIDLVNMVAETLNTQYMLGTPARAVET